MDDVIKWARLIRVALEQFEEGVHNADGTAAPRYETLKVILEDSGWQTEARTGECPTCHSYSKDLIGSRCLYPKPRDPWHLS